MTHDPARRSSARGSGGMGVSGVAVDGGPAGGRPVLPGIVSGLLLALCFPPSPFPFFAFLVTAPLAVSLARTGPGPRGSRDALTLGIVAGVVGWGLLLHWIPGALVPVAPWLAVPVYLAVVGGLAALMAGATRLTLALSRRGVPLVLALPAAWVAAEWVRSLSPGPGIPWLPLGNALVVFPSFAAPAEWVGALGLSLQAAVVGCLVARLTLMAPAGPAHGGRPASRASGTRPGLRPYVLVAAVALVPALAGWLRNRSLVQVPVVEAAALQFRAPGGPGRPPSEAEVERALEPLLATAPTAAGGTSVLVLPEGTLPGLPTGVGRGTGASPGAGPGAAPPPPTSAGLLGRLATAALQGGVPVVAGAYGAAPGGEGVRNTAVLVDADGALGELHAKRHLVPGIEGGLPGPLGRLAGGWGGRDLPLLPGERPGILEVDGRRLGVLICYESAFPDAVALPRREGAEAFLSLTHEGWFGDTGPLSRIPREHHIAHLRMRAVESRAGILRAAADGEALLVDPLGRIVARGNGGEDGWVGGTLMGVVGVPLHARMGDRVGPAALIFLLAGFLSGLVGVRRTPGAGSHTGSQAG